MSVSALVCLATGSEETEAVTVMDLLARAGFRVTSASIDPVGTLEVRCSRGVRLLADLPLSALADRPFDVIVLPGGIKGAEGLRDSPLLISCVRRQQQQGKLTAAICAAPAVVLAHHDLFPGAAMTGFPALKDRIPAGAWRNERVVYDAEANLVTSQGPATAMDFALKIIAILAGNEQAAEVAAQLVLPEGIDDYRRQA
ncbi:protein deglycase YajL [Sodalis sp. RH21]|uniref:protein deglycase YajL n=1 Tax=unclassified Sodalis (in: enterobacteria) TaxID=2636512 RepID=UPI0039B3CB35